MKISIFPSLIIISTQVTKRFDKNLTVVDQFMVRENLIEKNNNKERPKGNWLGKFYETFGEN